MKRLAFLCFWLVLAGCNQGGTTTPVASVAPPSATLAAQPTASVGPTLAATATARPTAVATPTADEPPPTRTPAPTASQQPAARLPAFSYPIGLPGRPLGDGFMMRHGYAVENTWFAPGNWHAGEDWYAVEGDTAGAGVYAAADGEVVYAGSDYPGRVVIIRHSAERYSMYGHLDYNLAVEQGRSVARGDLLGQVLGRSDGVPSHLHFEIRAFLTSSEINGAAPRYSFRCGVNCPPGPGYWPIAAPDHPSQVGWRNPTHVIAEHTLAEEVVVAAIPAAGNVGLWERPPEEQSAKAGIGSLALRPGARYRLLEISAGSPETQQTSAHSYRLWYRIELPDGSSGWVPALEATSRDQGSDGRPSSLRFNFLPVLLADERSGM